MSSHRTGIPRSARAAAIVDLPAWLSPQSATACPPMHMALACERQDTTATQNKSHDRTQEIGRCILVGERRQTGAPNPLRGTIYKKKCLVAIGEFKKFSGSVRS